MNSDIPNLSRRVSPAGNANISGREMLDSLCISTPITPREVEWKKQRLQARYKDEDLFYARHKIQGQPLFEEYVDFINQYEAELTDELTKTKIELESSKRSLQTLPHIFPDRNSYVDGLKDKTNELTLSNNQLANENSRLKKENEKLKAENEQQKQKINNMMAGMMQMFFNWQTEL